jgi:hypothetical protein
MKQLVISAALPATMGLLAIACPLGSVTAIVDVGAAMSFVKESFASMRAPRGGPGAPPDSR